MLELQEIFNLKSDVPYLPRFPELMTVIRREWLVQKRQIRIWWRMLFIIAFTMMCFAWFIAVLYRHFYYFGGEEYRYFAFFTGIPSYYIKLILALAQVLPAVSGSIARERETRSLDMLSLTPLRSSEILGGKLIAACLPVLIIILFTNLTAAIVAIVYAIKEVYPILFCIEQLEHPLTLLIEVIFCCLLALYCSTLFRSSMRALAIAMSILAVAFLLPIILSHLIFFINLQWAYYFIRPIVVISLLLPAIITAAGTTAVCVSNHNRLKSKSLPWPIHFLLMVVLIIVYLVLFFIVWNHQQPFTHYLVNYFGPPDYLFLGGFIGSYFGPADGNILQRLLVKFIILNVVGTATFFSFAVDRLEQLRRRLL